MDALERKLPVRGWREAEIRRVQLTPRVNRSMILANLSPAFIDYGGEQDDGCARR
jgi:hypothetical protein